MNFDENSLELMTIDMLREQGYDYLAGEDILRDYHDVILEDRLFTSLQKINPTLQESTIQETVRQIKNLSQNNVIRNNKEFSRFLHGGIPVSEYTFENGTTNTSVHLIDYENVENNDFLVVNQFTIIEHSEKRPDVIVFINGLPLIVFELKSMTREDVDLEDGYRQLKNYMNNHIPRLFYYNQFLVVSDGATAKAGTITCNYQRFNEWKKTSITDEAVNHNTHEPLIRGMMSKEVVLDLIRNFILFQDDAKILPAYHQYYGVKKAIERTLKTTDGRAGVIWHTQGSGKSFSMVFYAGNMIAKMNNPTIIVVTDRNDLDNQLFETFAKCQDFLRQKPIQIESRKDLIEKLEDKRAGGIIFTTLWKFEEDTGFLSDRSDILVIADEAHRSHYGINGSIKIDRETLTAEKKYGAAKYLHDAFPNATYIGFTGTPVEAKDHSTTNIFGDIIDIYDMTQSIEDGSTVPLYYEGRMAKVGLNAQVLKEIDEYYDMLEREDMADEDQINRSKAMMTNMSQIIEDPDRLEIIIKDILKHYETRKNMTANKAMIVAYSRNAGYTMYKKILEFRPDLTENVRMIMTPSNKDPEDMAIAIGSSGQKAERETAFKDPDSKFTIAIVVDMWITGFDVPSLGTMYVDKPMKAHNLMQAIARVNRVYKDKTGGLIVDYIGLKQWLLDALKTYTQRDQGKIVDDGETLKVLKDKIELARDILHGYDYSGFASADNAEKYRLINGGANFILETEERRKLFQKCSSDVKNLYSITSGLLDEESKAEVLYIISVRSFINKLTQPDGKLDIRQINEDVAQMLQQAIQDDELIQIGHIKHSKNLSLLNDQIIQRLAQMQQKNVAAEILKKALRNSIKQVATANVVLSEKFSERFEQIARLYNDRTAIANIEKILEQLISLHKDITEEIEKGNEYDLSDEEKAFFDALGNDPEVKELMQDETLVKIAKELVSVVNDNMTIDWDKKRDTQARMRIEIRKLLIKYNYPPNKSQKAVDTVIKQAELKCKNELEAIV